MSDGVKIGSAFVDVGAKQDQLKKDFHEAEKTTQKAVGELQSLMDRMKLKLDNRLMKMSIKEVQALHSKLAKKLQEKIKLNADIKSIERTRSALERVEYAMRDIRKETSKTENTAKGFFGRLKGMAGAVVGFFAIQSIARWTKEVSEEAGKLQGIKKAFDDLNEPGLLNNLRKATRGTVSDLDLMKQAVRANNFKVPLSQLSTYFEFATKRSAQTGESVDYLVDSIINGIGRKSTLVMDNLGISAAELQKEIKKTGDFGVAAGQIIQRELEKMGDVALTPAQRIQVIATKFENVKNKIGGALLPTVDKLTEAFGSFIDEAQEGGGLLTAIGVSARIVGSGLIIIVGALQMIGTLLGTVGAGLAHLFSGEFSAAGKAVGMGLDKIVDAFNNTKDTVSGIWEDIEKEVNGSGGNINPNPKVDKFEVDPEQVKSYFDQIKFYSKEYYDYRVKQIKEQAEIYKKQGLDAALYVKNETERLNKDLFKFLQNPDLDATTFEQNWSKLTDELKEKFINDPIEASVELDFKLNDEAMEKAEKEIYDSLNQLGKLRLDIYKDEDKEEREHQKLFDERLSAVGELSSAMAGATDKSKSFVTYLNQAVQAALRVAKAINSIQEGNQLTGVLGIFSGVLGFLGGLSTGGSVNTSSTGAEVSRGIPRFATGVLGHLVPSGHERDDYFVGLKSRETMDVYPTGTTPPRLRADEYNATAKEISRLNQNIYGMMEEIMIGLYSERGSGDLVARGFADGRDLQLVVNRQERRDSRYK